MGYGERKGIFPFYRKGRYIPQRQFLVFGGEGSLYELTFVSSSFLCSSEQFGTGGGGDTGT
jgi:hypothetical protein